MAFFSSHALYPLSTSLLPGQMCKTWNVSFGVFLKVSIIWVCVRVCNESRKQTQHFYLQRKKIEIYTFTHTHSIHTNYLYKIIVRGGLMDRLEGKWWLLPLRKNLISTALLCFGEMQSVKGLLELTHMHLTGCSILLKCCVSVSHLLKHSHTSTTI